MTDITMIRKKCQTALLNETSVVLSPKEVVAVLDSLQEATSTLEYFLDEEGWSNAHDSLLKIRKLLGEK